MSHRIPDTNNQRQNTLRSTNSKITRSKPSFLRLVAKTCTEIAKTCRDTNDQTSVKSFKKAKDNNQNFDKFSMNVYESVFEEKAIHNHGNDMAGAFDMKENINRISLEDYDISMMETYREEDPFIIASLDSICVVCKKPICRDSTCLATYGCKGCTSRMYCSVECFAFDWPSHVKLCQAGQADFLIKFLLNRINHQPRLKTHLESLGVCGFENSGRGAVLMMFEQVEAIKIFLKYNHDFSLEYYYSVQFMSLSMIQENFRSLSMYNVISTIITSYDTELYIPIVLIVKNTINNFIPAYTADPYIGISFIRRCCFQFQQRMQEQMQQQIEQKVQLAQSKEFEKIVQCTKHYLNMVSMGSIWDFKSRRIVCKAFQRIPYFFNVDDDHIPDWIELLKIYFLKGELKTTRREIYNRKYIEADESESTYRISLV